VLRFLRHALPASWRTGSPRRGEPGCMHPAFTRPTAPRHPATLPNHALPGPQPAWARASGTTDPSMRNKGTGCQASGISRGGTGIAPAETIRRIQRSGGDPFARNPFRQTPREQNPSRPTPSGPHRFSWGVAHANRPRGFGIGPGPSGRSPDPATLPGSRISPISPKPAKAPSFRPAWLPELARGSTVQTACALSQYRHSQRKRLSPNTLGIVPIHAECPSSRWEGR